MADQFWSKWLRKNRTSKKAPNRSKSLYVPCLQQLERRLAPANDIVYQFSSADASGSLNGVPFSHASVQFSIPADTNNVGETTFGAGVPAVGNLTGYVAVSGLPTSTISTPLYVFNRHSSQDVGFGFDTPPRADIINLVSEGVGLDQYDLKSPMGPAVSSYVYYVPNYVIPTNNGNLSFNVTPVVTFQAVSALPTASFTSQPSANTNSTTATFGFTGGSPVPGVGIDHFETSLDGGAFTPATSPTTVSAAEGSHTYRVRAVDTGGKVGPAVSYSWTVDLTAPTSAISASPPAISPRTSATFHFTGNDPPAGGVSTGVNYFESSLDGAPFVAGGGPIAFTNLPLGEHVFQVRAVDNAGNVGADMSYSWTVDFESLTASITASPPSISQSRSATFSFSANDPTVVDHLEYALDGAAFAVGDGPVTYTNLSLGEHVFRVRAVDDAGNVGTVATYSWTITFSMATISSIARSSPASATNASTLTFAVTFGQSVAGVNPADFTLNSTGTVRGTIGQVTGSGTQYTVTVDGVTGDGTATLRVVDSNLATLPAINTASFQARQTFGSIGRFTVGDLNGDNKPDVVGTFGAAGVVFLGNGDGTFRRIPTFSIGGSKRNLALADFDRDGKLDLIFDDFTPSSAVTVLFGNGNGRFHGQTTFSGGAGARGPVVGDLNADGNPDIAVVNNNGTTVSLLFGNGNGTFQPTQSIVVGSQPTRVAIGDVNGDGKSDLVVTTSSSGGVLRTFLGNGDGSFLPQISTGFGSSPDFLTLADVNGDGKLDAVSGNSGSGPERVALSNGDGRFAAATSIAGSGTTGGTVVAAADLNGDGYADVVSAANGGDNFGFAISTGDGSFQPRVTWSFSAGSGTVATDVNGDGRPDVLASYNLGVLVNTSPTGPLTNGIFTVDHTAPAVFVDAKPPSSSVSPMATFAFRGADASGIARFEASIDNAGFATVPSLYTVGMADGAHTLQVRAVDLAGNVSPTVSYSWTVDATWPKAAIARSVPSTTVTDASSVTYVVTFSEPVTGVDASDFAVATTGTATSSAPQVVGSGATYTVTVNDVAGDGTLGVNLVNDGSIRDLAGNTLAGDGALRYFPSQTLAVGALPAGSTVKLNLADVNGDGKTDFVWVNPTGNSVSVYLGNGDTTFKPPATFAVGENPTAAVVGDVNSDGKLDIAVSDGTDDSWEMHSSILLGNGDGTFGAAIRSVLPSRTVVLAVTDLDGDGTADFVTTANGTVGYKGNGDGTFSTSQILANISSAGGINVVDVSGDGVADFVALTTASSLVSVKLNNGNGTFRPKVDYPTPSSTTGAFTADLNSDGIVDLLVSHVNSFLVFLGIGGGTFQSSQTSSIAGGVKSVVAADLNGDGLLDLSIATWNPGKSAVMLGNGDGTFSAAVTLADSSSVPNNAFVADLNSDGLPDLVAFNADRSVSVRLANGNVVGPSYTIDNSGPTVSFTATPAAFTNAATAIFSFSGNSPSGVDHFETSLDGSSFATATSPKSLAGLGEGVHVFRVRAIDVLGKVGATTSYTWTVDTTLPTASFTAQPPTFSAGSNSFSFTGSDPTGSGVESGVNRFETSLDGASFVTSTSPKSLVGLSYGSHVFRVRAIDNAGNVSAVRSYAWNVDPVSPTVVSIVRATAATAINASSASFTVTFSESVTGVDASDFAVATTGTVTSTGVSQFAGSGAVYTVTVAGIVGDGTLGVNLVSDDSIVDGSGNVLYSQQQNYKPFVSHAALASFVVPTADFDSDGKVDLAVGENAIGILLGNGNGTFQSLQTSASPTANTSVIAADFNGDLIADFVTFSSGGTTVAIQLGNGNGTFKPAATYLGPASSSNFWVGDLNGDARPDVVVGTTSTTMSVFLNNGDGSLKPRVNYTNSVSGSASIADVNNDLVSDVVFRNNSNVSVFLGNGDGTLKPRTSFAASYQLAQLGDVNADGKLDLLAVSTSGFFLQLGNGNGTFKAATSIASSGAPRSIAVGDLNGDGRIDVVLGKTSTAAVAVLMGNGNGTFAAERTFAIAAAVYSQAQMTIADLNNDGRLDLAIPSQSPNVVSVLLDSGGVNAGESYLIDHTSPTASLTASPAMFSKSSTASFSFTGSDPTVGGAASGVARFETSFDGAAFATATSPRSLIGLGEGVHSFQVRAVDNVGNVGEAISYTWTVDTTLPTASFTAQPSSTSAATTSFSFTGSDPTGGGVSSGVNRFETKLDGASFVTSTSPKSLSGLSQGSHTFQVRAVDNAGNVGAAITYTWSVDATLPTASFTAQPPTSTTSTTATFSFTGSDAGAVSSGVDHLQTSLDGAAFAAVTSPASFTVAEGSHTYQVRAVDAVGNVGNAVSYTWVVDLTAPTASITGNPAAFTNNATSFSFTGNDPAVGGGSSGVHHLETSLDGASFATSTSPKSLTGLGEGSHSFRVRAVDNAGNVGSATDFTWIVDLTPPTASISSQPPTITNSTNASFTFAGTDPSGGGASGVKRLEYSLDGGAFVAAPGTISFSGLAVGTHAFRVRAVDNVENTGIATSYSWTIEQTAPSFLLIVPAVPTTTTNASNVSYTVTFSEAVAGLDAADFVVSTTGALSAGTPQVTGSGPAYNVAIDVAGNGTLKLSLVGNPSIQDLAGNSLTAPLFQPAVSYAAGMASAAAPVADFNSDGIPDLAFGESGVGIALGNGDGVQFGADRIPAT